MQNIIFFDEGSPVLKIGCGFNVDAYMIKNCAVVFSKRYAFPLRKSSVFYDDPYGSLSSPYYFTIPNSEFRNHHVTNYGIRNFEL